MKTIKRNDRGPAVEDVQRRLRVLGYELVVDGEFLDRTAAAVRAFRAHEGLPEGEAVDERAWSALVDATFALGDRILYLRMPHFHGGDVRELQEVLDVLGFVSGGADGIFGAHTESALREFQASVGLVDDGIAGNTTYDAVSRLRHAWEGKAPASGAAVEHMGYARAAEVLERIEACFYGLDESGRRVATRMANLAWATTPAARVFSADSISGEIPPSMLKVGICIGGPAPREGATVEFSDDAAFAKRLGTSVASAGERDRRVVIAVGGNAGDGIDLEGERLEQHLAVVLLDAFCTALS